MGVGYPLDLVVCSALGCDMYDCVYPTRTGRFGVALVDGRTCEGCDSIRGLLTVKQNRYAEDLRVIDKDCSCQCCQFGKGFSRAKLHTMMKDMDPLGPQLMTSHNVAYMLKLVSEIRNAIMEGRYGQFVQEFISSMYPKGVDRREGKVYYDEWALEKDMAGGKWVEDDDEGYVVRWVVEALTAAGISLK